MNIPKKIQKNSQVFKLIKDEPLFKHTEKDLNTVMMRNRHHRNAFYSDGVTEIKVAYSDIFSTEEDIINSVQNTLKSH